MKKIILRLLAAIALIYLITCGTLYFNQENLLFHPSKLAQNYQFDFAQPFEELNIESTDGKRINGLLFKAKDSKGLIFYLHGNARNLSIWGSIAQTYTNQNYDLFILDYRGFGKSEGEIISQNQLFDDNQCAYNEMKKRYNESNIIVLGYSIGSGLAARLASTNNPRQLILQAPYYNMTYMMKQRFAYTPTFLLKYPLTTNEYLQQCKMPVVMFHGDQDEVIPYQSSILLKKEFKPQDTLITLIGQRHSGITDNPDYKSALPKILPR